MFWAPEGVCGGHKIYTGSDRMSLHPVIGACATSIIDDQTHCRGYKQSREGGEALTSLIGIKVELKSCKVES
jgi:hypothetical protein